MSVIVPTTRTRARASKFQASSKQQLPDFAVASKAKKRWKTTDSTVLSMLLAGNWLQCRIESQKKIDWELSDSRSLPTPGPKWGRLPVIQVYYRPHCRHRADPLQLRARSSSAPPRASWTRPWTPQPRSGAPRRSLPPWAACSNRTPVEEAQMGGIGAIRCVEERRRLDDTVHGAGMYSSSATTEEA